MVRKSSLLFFALFSFLYASESYGDSIDCRINMNDDDTVDGADLSTFVEAWLFGDSLADLTTKRTNPGDPGYGVADNEIDGTDLSYFVGLWLELSSSPSPLSSCSGDSPIVIDQIFPPTDYWEAIDMHKVSVSTGMPMSLVPMISGGRPPYKFEWYFNGERIQDGEITVASTQYSNNGFHALAKNTSDGVLNLSDIRIYPQNLWEARSQFLLKVRDQDGQEVSSELTWFMVKPKAGSFLSVKAVSAGSSVDLLWEPPQSDTGTWTYTIYERQSQQRNTTKFDNVTFSWNQIGQVNANEETRFRLNDLALGQKKEFKVVSSTGAIGYVFAGNRANDIRHESPGIILLAIESSLMENSTLTSKIERLKEDLVREGWVPETLLVDRDSSPESLRESIKAIYQTKELNSVFLIGRVPRVHMMNGVDGHGIRELPMINFYGELSSQWSKKSSCTEPSNEHCYNNQSIPSQMEVPVGLVDFEGVHPGLGDPQELLIRYLDKDHAFRSGLWRDQNLDRGFYHAYEIPTSAPQQTFSSSFGPEGYYHYGNVKDENGVGGLHPSFNLDLSFLWVKSYGLTPDFIDSSTGLMKDVQMTCVFCTWMRSWILDWASSTASRQALRGTIAAPGYSLGAIYSGRPDLMIHVGSQNDSIGEIVQHAQNNDSSATGYIYPLEYRSYYEGALHLALMGDPSLRQTYSCRPSGLTSTSSTLRWDFCDDESPLEFRVYASNQKLGEYEFLGTTSGSARSFSLAGADSFGHYLVRPVFLEQTPGSGSYLRYGSGGLISSF